MNTQPTFTTDRLLLRPFTLDDAPGVQRLAGDEAVASTTLNMPHPYEDGMAEEWIGSHQAHYEAGESISFAIVRAADTVLVGAISLVNMSARHQRAEIGYWIGVPYWNQGYCTEAARKILQYAFEDLNLHRIIALHFSRNPASGKVMQKLGMKHEGTLRQHAERWGQYEDLHVYGILREEYLA